MPKCFFEDGVYSVNIKQISVLFFINDIAKIRDIRNISGT